MCTQTYTNTPTSENTLAEAHLLLLPEYLPITRGYGWKSHQKSESENYYFALTSVISAEGSRKQHVFIYFVAVIAAPTVHLLTVFSKS